MASSWFPSILDYRYFIPNTRILEDNINYFIMFDWNRNRVYERQKARLYELFKSMELEKNRIIR